MKMTALLGPLSQSRQSNLGRSDSAQHRNGLIFKVEVCCRRWKVFVSQCSIDGLAHVALVCFAGCMHLTNTFQGMPAAMYSNPQLASFDVC